ncbi:MAG: serine/threonine-protein kinase [Pirellulaceae bacterium]|nr:serine/threonine-protein kinase [Pirellulaceae bacterium]
MSKSELEVSSFSPTELQRLQTVMDAGSAEIERLADVDVQQCLAALQGAMEVSSTSDATESTANRRFSAPRFVGSGAFGIVYFVFDNTLGIDVAIKMLRPSRNSPIVQQRFLEEAKITANLSHAGIVRLFDSGTIGQIPYITSAVVSGGSLADWIAKHPQGMKPEMACKILLSVAEAVAFAHSKLTFHRDIKPSNILMDTIAGESEGADAKEVRTVLTDFGLAKRWDRTEAALTLEGDILGTSRYMSPEQASGALEDYSVASEVFTLGIVLHELLAGKVPFDGKSGTEIRRAIVQSRPAALRQLRPNLSRDLNAIVQKCLEKSPEQRYESVLALVRDLQRYLAGQPVEAARPSLLRLAIWNARKHPLATGSLMLTALTICIATTAIGVAWWNQLQSAKRERQTKIDYVILFGKLVDDVVTGEKNQQTAILESLNGFKANIERDLETSPEDQDLRHLLSLVLHYRTVTLERAGQLEEALRSRVDSVAILKALRLEFPNNPKYRFQYLFGMAKIRVVMDRYENAKLLPYMASKIQFASRSEIVNAMIPEIDQLMKDFRKPSYEDACNQFRVDTGFEIKRLNPEKGAEMIEQVIADTKAFAKQHPDKPIYIKPALIAYWKLTSEAEEAKNGELALENAAIASECFEQYLGNLFDKLWVRTLFLENEVWHAVILCKYEKYDAALALSDRCLTIADELIDDSHFRVLMISYCFQLRTVRYMSFKALGNVTGAEEELVKLQQVAKSALEYESTRDACHTHCTNSELPESVTSIFESTVSASP